MSDELDAAVDKLTKPRVVHTSIVADDGTFVAVHSEQHPPLLTLLIDGTGVEHGPKGREDPLPIDADALELWGQVHDLVRLWCRQLGVPFGDDLLVNVQGWHAAHLSRVRNGQVGAGTDADVTRMVQGWVRMVERKFDPDRVLEWLDPCPAVADGVVCGARRVMVDGLEVFAITVNVTRMLAECRKCGTVWAGLDGLKRLRFQCNTVGVSDLTSTLFAS